MIHSASATAAPADFPNDLAISAVASDADFVAEIAGEMATRLRRPPEWQSASDLAADGGASPLRAGTSRIALVLHQQLWGHDPVTTRDAELLRERLGDRPRSVRVLRLDDAPVPDWLAGLPVCDLPSAGRARAVDFVVEAVTGAGGTVRPLPQPAAAAGSHWPEPPAPFLAQLRAYGALRRELDSIIQALESAVQDCRTSRGDQTCEVQVTPNRVIARLPHAAVSFSWVTGRGTTIADGRLMVIAWNGLSARAHGLAALRSATPIHERVYRPDATGPQQWYWRADDLTGRPYSSANLAADWLARTSIADAGFAESVAAATQ